MLLLAAGSTITSSVEDGDMGIARSRQSIKKVMEQYIKQINTSIWKKGEENGKQSGCICVNI